MGLETLRVVYWVNSDNSKMRNTEAATVNFTVNDTFSGVYTKADILGNRFGNSLVLGAFDISAIAALPSGNTWSTLYTLNNGCTIEGNHNGNYIGCRLVISGNNVYIATGQNEYDSKKFREKLYMFFLHDYDTDQTKACLLYTDSQYPDELFFSIETKLNSAQFATFTSDQITTRYNFTSVSFLSGNNNQFYLKLSEIAVSLLEDPDTTLETTDASKFSLYGYSNLYDLVVNLLDGVETTIVYCGLNYMTATRRTTTGIGDVLIIYVTLKFYYMSGVLAYTSSEIGISLGTNVDKYLCFIWDPDEEVGALDIINHNRANGKFIINQGLPVQQDMYEIYVWLLDNGREHEIGTPYDTGSTDDGGEPGTPRIGDNIPDAPLPTVSGLDLGIVTLYRPTAAQVSSISQFLWSDNVLDNFKKYFNNFADNIIGFFILPYVPDSLPSKTFKVGNMTSEVTGVEYVSTRYIDVDMGSARVEARWGTYLDFNPFTKIQIYLPYLGLHSLDTDELMDPTNQGSGTLNENLGSTLALTYRIDMLTGVIVAKIKVNGQLRYEFEGKAGANIPLTGQTYASIIQGIVQAGAGLAATLATGGLTAPVGVGGAAAAIAGTVNASKASVERIGNISGDASMLATKTPYLIITAPNKPELESQEKFTGFPCYKTGTLGSFGGFTQVIEAHVEGISCTEEERKKILEYLKNGVII